GGSGQYLLKPVVTVIPRYVSGVQGYVDPALGAGATRVSLQLNGTIVKATVPDSTGKFLLQPVAPGNYTLVMAASGRTSAVVTGVPVVAETVTPVASAALPIALTASASASATGTAPADTLVRALQSLAGNTVEIDGQYVDSVTGAYAFSLPINAPLVAAYAAAPAPLVFAANTQAAARYTLRASRLGFADKDAVLPVLAAGSSTTTNFTFP
ncbi:MAG: carboxypeptidase-like regulatory domain-containing protein, partial [Acidovorax soli]|uniref:carboxypeptidase-like regulatory domain-containing protein n=1 Tax=Acidovorax soli TaxID=592050 RepID=UPI0026ECEF33